MYCLKNFVFNCLSLMRSHRMASASVGFFLFSRAQSFKREYLSLAAHFNSSFIGLPAFLVLPLTGELEGV